MVAAGQYLQHFASDRSHMRRPDGSWMADPPPWPCLVACDGTPNNITKFWDMTPGPLFDRAGGLGTGAVMDGPVLASQMRSGHSVAGTERGSAGGQSVGRGTVPESGAAAVRSTLGAINGEKLGAVVSEAQLLALFGDSVLG